MAALTIPPTPAQMQEVERLQTQNVSARYRIAGGYSSGHICVTVRWLSEYHIEYFFSLDNEGRFSGDGPELHHPQ